MGVYIGLDIGGTKLLVAAADKNGNIIRKETAYTPSDFKTGIALIKNLIIKVANGEKIVAIGASVGGPLDWKKGIVSPLHQKEWRNIPLKKIMTEEFDCPFYVDVDTNVAAIGEWKFRNDKPSRLLYVTISTGVGGGFIIDGKIYRGKEDSHPEIGHQTVPWKGKFDSVKCTCGADGCLEELVSGNGIKKLYGKQPENLTTQQWEEVGHNLGQGLRNLSVIYAPDVIALGGGVAIGANEKLLKPARTVVESNLKIVPAPKIELSVLGYETALIGCICLAMEGKKLGY